MPNFLMGGCFKSQPSSDLFIHSVKVKKIGKTLKKNVITVKKEPINIPLGKAIGRIKLKKASEISDSPFGLCAHGLIAAPEDAYPWAIENLNDGETLTGWSCEARLSPERILLSCLFSNIL